MPDLRYHLISLISVFLALAVGVLLGTAIADRGGVRDAQIQDIRNDLERQRNLISERDEDISELQQELSANEAVMQGMSETVIADRLESQDVALVRGPWVNETVAQEVGRSLSTAGADVVDVAELPEPGPPSDPGEATQTTSEYVETARELVSPQDAGTFGTTAESFTDLDVIIFLGGGEPPPETSDDVTSVVNTAESRMFEVWSDVFGLRVVTAEAAAGEYSQVPFFSEENLPSVDNVDSPAGRAGLILLASGEAGGAYGIKPTASAPFPPDPG